MRKNITSLTKLQCAVILFVAGILLGSVFVFGMQYWNAETTRQSCSLVETQFLSREEIRQQGSLTRIKEIAVDCANGRRYFIDGALINTELREALSALSEQDNITLLIHPNSNTIVEFSTDEGELIVFEEAIDKLDGEKTAFLFLGIFLYFCSFMGLCYILSYVWGKIKR